MDDIHSTFDELQKTLNVRKSVLLMELEVNYGVKHKVRPESSQTSYKIPDIQGHLLLFPDSKRGSLSVIIV